MANILVVSENQAVFQKIASCFSADDRVEYFAKKQAALDILHRKRFDFVFIDLVLLDGHDGSGYKHSLQSFWIIYPTIEIIVMSNPESIREAVKAVKSGASNYLTYPIMPEEVKYVAESISESQLVLSELNYLRDQFLKADPKTLTRTNSPRMRDLYEKIGSVAPTVSTVLLTGETGTGKGVLARIIHQLSPRKNAQFISVHCGAITETLIESELFGHEKGAFTGAIRRKLGKFEIAKDGTIFLDEIATVSPSTQIKLLQVLQDKQFQRVGGEETIEANARVIAATNMDLMELCDAGQFRKDLYYRLNVFPVELPPLRNRKEDIPLLVENFLRQLNKFNPREIYSIHPDVLAAFENYSWPGNIRELENLVERAHIIEKSSVLTPASFPVELFAAQPRLQRQLLPDPTQSLAEVRQLGLEVLEKSYLSELLMKQKGRIKAAASVARITPRQLHNLMKKYDLHKENFK